MPFRCSPSDLLVRSDPYEQLCSGRRSSVQDQPEGILVLPCLLTAPAADCYHRLLSRRKAASRASVGCPTYVPVVVLVTCTLLINNKVIKDLKGCADVIDGLQIENINLQWELDAYENENDDLRDRLLESESGRKEAERLAKLYWEMLPEDLRKFVEDRRKLEDAIKEMLELNSSQDTSSGR